MRGRGVDVSKTLFYILGKSSPFSNYVNKSPASAGHKKKTILSLEDIESFFEFIIVKIIIFDKEIVHIQ